MGLLRLIDDQLDHPRWAYLMAALVLAVAAGLILPNLVFAAIAFALSLVYCVAFVCTMR